MRTRHGPLALDLDRREAVVFGRTAPLTRLEFELLRILIEAPGRTFSRDELLTRLHARDGNLPSDRALDNLVVRLRRKLADDPRRPRLIQSVWGVGYRLIAPPVEAAVELARQILDMLPVPAIFITPKRTVLAGNEAARELFGGLTEGAPCFDLLGCHADGCSLKDRCPGMAAQAARVPTVVAYGVRGGERAMAVSAFYIPLELGRVSGSLLALVPSDGKPGAANAVNGSRATANGTRVAVQGGRAQVNGGRTQANGGGRF